MTMKYEKEINKPCGKDMHKEHEKTHTKHKKKKPEKKKKHQEKVKLVMDEYKEGKLHSGSKKGPVVKNPKQAIAIALSESRRMGKKK